MKRLIFILFIFTISSCSELVKKRDPANSRVTASTVSQADYTECLNDVKKACYEKFPFHEMSLVGSKIQSSLYKHRYMKCFMADSQNQCSKLDDYQAERSEFEKSFANEFESIGKERKQKFLGNWELLKKIKSALWNFKKLIKTHTKAALNGLGVGVSLGAQAVGGITQGYEMVHHNGKLGFFCAPGMKVATDIGVYADLVFVNTLMCRDNKHYRGQFFTVALSGSLELAGIPGEVGAGYSLGIELFKFQDQLRKIKRDIEFSTERLNEEIYYLEEFVKNNPELRSKLGTVVFYNKVMRTLLSMKSKFNPLNTTPLRLLIQEAFRKKFSLGSLGREYAQLTKSASEKHNFVELVKVAEALESSLSGCDSFSTFAGASISLSPISLSASMTSYGLAGELSFYGLKSALLLEHGRNAKKARKEFYFSLYDIVKSIGTDQCNKKEITNLLDFWTKD